MARNRAKQLAALLAVLASLFAAAPASAQVVKATVKIDGMT